MTTELKPFTRNQLTNVILSDDYVERMEAADNTAKYIYSVAKKQALGGDHHDYVYEIMHPKYATDRIFGKRIVNILRIAFPDFEIKLGMNRKGHYINAEALFIRVKW